MTEHDKRQDQRLDELEKENREQSEQIERNLLEMEALKDYIGKYLGKIYESLMPEHWRDPVRKYVVRPLVILASSVIAIFGAWDFGVWYMDRLEIGWMVDRYIRVAEEIYNKENNADVALPFIEKALDLKPDNPEGCFLKAYMQGMSATRSLVNLGRPFNKEELDAAHTAYAEALYLADVSPKRPEPYILQGQILAALKETGRAREAIAKALELEPRNALAHVRMAMVHFDAKDIPAGEKSLEKALELDPGNKWAWLWKGIAATDYKKDPVAARACCDRALESDGKFDLAYYNRGWTYVIGKEKDYALARVEMKKALKVNPAYKEACYAMGMFYGYENNYPVAKIWLDKAIELDGNFLLAHKGRGIVCGEMRDYEGALESFGAAIKLDPMNADLYVRRAKASMCLDRYDDALRDLRFAEELDPTAQRTRMYLGDLYLKMQDTERALEYYDSALKSGSQSDDVYARKAAVLVELKRIDEALAALDSAISVTQYRPERFWLKKAEILRGIPKLEEARKAYEKARSINADLREAWRGEAAVCRKLRDVKGWWTALSAYVELVPTDASARRELSEVWWRSGSTSSGKK